MRHLIAKEGIDKVFFFNKGLELILIDFKDALSEASQIKKDSYEINEMLYSLELIYKDLLTYQSMSDSELAGILSTLKKIK